MSVLPYRSDKTLQQLKNEGIVGLIPHIYHTMDGIHIVLLFTHTELLGHVIKDLIRNNIITEFSLSNKIETEIEYKEKK